MRTPCSMRAWGTGSSGCRGAAARHHHGVGGDVLLRLLCAPTACQPCGAADLARQHTWEVAQFSVRAAGVWHGDDTVPVWWRRRPPTSLPAQLSSEGSGSGGGTIPLTYFLHDNVNHQTISIIRTAYLFNVYCACGHQQSPRSWPVTCHGILLVALRRAGRPEHVADTSPCCRVVGYYALVDGPTQIPLRRTRHNGYMR